MYIHLQILKYIKLITKCNNASYIFHPCTHTYRLWNILTIFSNVILTYIYIFPILYYYYYIPLHILKSINYIINCNIVPY